MSQITNIKYILKMITTYLVIFGTLISSLFTGGDVIDLSKVTAGDYAHIKSTYRQMILGPETIDMNDADIASKVNGLVAWGLSRQSALVKDGTVPWIGVAKITNSADISTVYANIFAMAKAYACKSGASYQNEELLADILYTLDWMYDNCYGSKVSQLTKFGNWWDWEIGAPTNLVGALVLLEQSIGKELVVKYLEPVNYFVPLPKRTSANLVDSAYICIGAAALEADGLRIHRSRKKLDDVFKYVKTGDGFYTDGSYVMHVDIPYQGGYGTIMLEALSRVILALDGTFFEISAQNIAVQTAWALDSFLPLMFKGGLPGMVRGRNIVRNVDDIGIGFAAVTGMLRMAKYTDAGNAQKLSSAVKYFYNINSTRYVAASGIFDLCLFRELTADDTIVPADNSGTKVFPKMDRVAKVTEDYSVGISMASKRIAKYEALNGENGKGWYTGDGMLYIDNTAYDFDAAYWREVNFYRLPGTTVTTRERKNEDLNLIKCLPNNAFAGGVSLDGCAVAAMQLLGVSTEFKSTLEAKKAWFIFDDEIVALGADMSCSDNFSAETVIENRRLNDGAVFEADGTAVTGGDGALINPKSVFVTGLGGIYLPDNTTVQYRRVTNNSEFLELWFDHGKDFSGAEYAYTILPGISAVQTTAYAGNPDVEILANTARVQAVREKNLGISGYVFHQKGSFDGITVNKPCIVMTRQTGDTLTVTVSDPTQSLNRLCVSIGAAGLLAKTVPGNVKCKTTGSSAQLNISTCDKSGLGTTVVFER